MSRTIVFSDVHGCFDEMVELYAKLEVKKEDRVIFAGDLVDRGPKVLEVLGFVRASGHEVILGNHEEKLIRYAKHEVVRRETGKKNPMKAFDPVRQAEHEAIVAGGLLDWIKSFPLYIRFEDGGMPWIVSHAGIPCNKPIDELDPKTLVRTRWVDKVTGAFAASNDPDIIPEGACYWSERWRGPESVIHGHIVQDEDIARIDGFPESFMCYGIDTGCCFGGFLTAAVFTGRGKPSLYNVKAAREYFPRHRKWPRISHT